MITLKSYLKVKEIKKIISKEIDKIINIHKEETGIKNISKSSSSIYYKKYIEKLTLHPPRNTHTHTHTHTHSLRGYLL